MTIAFTLRLWRARMASTAGQVAAVARVDHDGLPGLLVAENGAVALQRAHGQNLVNHISPSIVKRYGSHCRDGSRCVYAGHPHDHRDPIDRRRLLRPSGRLETGLGLHLPDCRAGGSAGCFRLYNFLTKKSYPPGYHMWFGIKFLLALHVLSMLILLTRRTSKKASNAAG